MKQAERDKMLISMSERLDYVKDQVERHTQKIDEVMPRLASHGTSIKWIKIMGSAGSAALAGILSFIASHK